MHRDDQQELAEYLKDLEARTPGFLTYVERPKHTEQVGTWSDLSPDGGQGTAIIVSGPMVYDHHFTRDTIRLYRKHYPESLVILSTWSDEESDGYLKDMGDDKTLILQSKRTDEPDYAQGRNMVYTALKTAAEWGVTHALRTSTQHRLYAPNLIEFFKGLQKAFPLADGHPQKQRIITSNHVALKYVPYYVNAAVMFGHIDDMLAYWAAPDGGHPELSPIDATASVIERSKIDPGCYYTRTYLERIGVKFNPESLQDSWRIMAEQFCFVDCQTIDIFWLYPDRWWDERRHIQQYANFASQRWAYQDWLILNMHPERVALAPEYILNKMITVEIKRNTAHG